MLSRISSLAAPGSARRSAAANSPPRERHPAFSAYRREIGKVSQRRGSWRVSFPMASTSKRARKIPAPESPELLQVEAARASGRPFVFFVGSSLQANQEAVECDSRDGGRAGAAGRVPIRICRACLRKGAYEHQVIAFGSADEALLAKLYLATDIVLAPLTSGTGTSLKVLEAFVHEKALIATRTGVRGYPVRDGSNASSLTSLGAIQRSSLRFAPIPPACAPFGERDTRSSRPTTIASFASPTLNASTNS